QLLGRQPPFQRPRVFIDLLRARRASDHAAHPRLRAEPGEGQLPNGVVVLLGECLELIELAEPLVAECAGGRVAHSTSAGEARTLRRRLTLPVLAREESAS